MVAQTEIIELKVTVARLKVGMYVCRLDRSWLDTPYTMQGFLVDGQLRTQFREVASADLINRPVPLRITRAVPLSAVGLRLEQIELTANSD